MPTLTIRVNVSDQDRKVLANNSLERLITRTQALLTRSNNPEAQDISSELTELKGIASSLWFCASSEALVLYLEKSSR